MSLTTLTLLVAGAVNASAAAPGFPRPFDVGARYSREIHVNAAAPAGGDGSAAKPFRTIGAALAQAQPGTRVRIASVGDGGVVIDAGGQASGLHIADPRHLVIENIPIRNAVPHGISIDMVGCHRGVIKRAGDVQRLPRLRVRQQHDRRPG